MFFCHKPLALCNNEHPSCFLGARPHWGNFYCRIELFTYSRASFAYSLAKTLRITQRPRILAKRPGCIGGKTAYHQTSILWSPKWSHTFLSFGNLFPNCTGYLLHRAFWQEFFRVIQAPPEGTFCERPSYTHEFSELIFQLRTHLFRDRKRMGMAKFKRTFARTLQNNLRAPNMKMWGFRGSKFLFRPVLTSTVSEWRSLIAWSKGGRGPAGEARRGPGEERARPGEERARPGEERARPGEERARTGSGRVWEGGRKTLVFGV